MSIKFARNGFLINCAILAVFAAKPGLANQVGDFPLNRKVDVADVVFIGKVLMKDQEEKSEVDNDSFIIVKPQSVLKGSPPQRLRLQVKGAIAEMNIDCCAVGDVRLFFLQETIGGRYIGVDGRYSIYPM